MEAAEGGEVARGAGEAMVQQGLQQVPTSTSRALKGRSNLCFPHGQGSEKAGEPAYFWRLWMKSWLARSWCRQGGDSNLSLNCSHSLAERSLPDDVPMACRCRRLNLLLLSLPRNQNWLWSKRDRLWKQVL